MDFKNVNTGELIDFYNVFIGAFYYNPGFPMLLDFFPTSVKINIDLK